MEILSNDYLQMALIVFATIGVGFVTQVIIAEIKIRRGLQSTASGMEKKQ